MNPEDLLALIRTHWPDIRRALDAERRDVLRTRLGALAAAPAEEWAVRRAAQGVKLALLDLPPGHPVRAALDGPRLAEPPWDVPAVAERARELQAWLTDTDTDTDADADTTDTEQPAHTEGILADARRRLLAEPSLSPEEVRVRCAGGAEGTTGLIHLDDPVRGPRYPAFQFAGGDGDGGVADRSPWCARSTACCSLRRTPGARPTGG